MCGVFIYVAYPFGMPMPQRNIEGQYPYAYQGQEKDSETGMEAFELRLWDARIGRWLTTDPYGQFSSPYLGMGNNPISMIDPDGGKSGPGCTGCPNAALHEFISNTTVPVDGSLGFDPIFPMTGGMQGLGEVVVTGSKITSSESLIISGVSLGANETLKYLESQTKGFSLKRDLFYNPFNPDKTLFSLPKEVTPKAKFTFRGFGYGLSAYSALNTEADYDSGIIDGGGRYYNHSLNLIGTAFPGIGVGIGTGDYLGRTYHKEIANEISTEGTITVNTVSNLLKVMGIPPSKEIQTQWETNGKPTLFNRLFN